MRAHPRSRGENHSRQCVGVGAMGSSPLTRGKPPAINQRQSQKRLIPAHAGKTVRAGITGAGIGAHPRSRGENENIPAAGAGWNGSSPLTRGKPGRPYGEPLGIGLIPAHAGKTGGRRSSATHPGAHPRSRGENARRSGSALTTSGSSPLTRGKPVRAGISPNKLGLIPAHAGKTSE